MAPQMKVRPRCITPSRGDTPSFLVILPYDQTISCIDRLSAALSLRYAIIHDSQCFPSEKVFASIIRSLVPGASHDFVRVRSISHV